MQLVCPPLSPEEVGTSGARFVAAEFAPGEGTEQFLCIHESRDFVGELGAIRELSLFATTLALNTDEGPIAAILWRLGRQSKAIVYFEHFLDPCDLPTRQLLTRIDKQTRLKLVLRDNTLGGVEGFREFANNFRLSDFAVSLARVVQGMSAGPFAERMRLARDEYAIEDLIEESEKFRN